MRSMLALPAIGLILALSAGACSPAENGEGATRGGESTAPELAPLQEPDAAALLIPPPPGAEYQPASSAAESEDGSGGPSRYGTSGGYEAEESVTYVYLTDEPLEAVARYFVGAREESPYYVDLGDFFDFDGGYTDLAEEELAVEEEPAAGLPPDELEAMYRQYHEQGILDDEEVEEALAEMGAYREIYPAIRDLTLRTLDFEIEESPEDQDEYRVADVELVRPYIDPAGLEVRDRTAIVYTIHLMRRQQD